MKRRSLFRKSRRWMLLARTLRRLAGSLCNPSTDPEADQPYMLGPRLSQAAYLAGIYSSTLRKKAGKR
mgnify:CR=1 FL=1